MPSKHHILDAPERPALKAALDALKAEKRKPTDADAPPPSLFPMTPAARAARELSRARRRKR